jgi:release factor glutamine methyltransferase
VEFAPETSTAARLKALFALAVLKLLSNVAWGELRFKGLRVIVPRGCFAPIFVSTSLLSDAASALVKNGLAVEVGAGCGPLALSLAQNKKVEIVGTDVDLRCLKASLANAKLNGLEARYHPVACAEASCLRDRAFDYALANPPYFPFDQSLSLSACGGAGLEVYKRILADAARVLRQGGLLLFTASTLTGRVEGALLMGERWALFDRVRAYAWRKPSGPSPSRPRGTRAAGSPA